MKKEVRTSETETEIEKNEEKRTDLLNDETEFVDHRAHSSREIPEKSKVNRISFWLGIILCVLLIPILIGNIFIIVKSSLNPDEVPTVLGYAPMIVLTNSMVTNKSDSLHSGDLIVAKSINLNKLKEKDVILFKKGKVPVIHRIQKVEKLDGKVQYITKGDANNVADLEPVQQKEVIGRYCGKISKLGTVILFLKTPLGMLLSIGSPIGLFLGVDFYEKRKSRIKKV